MFRQRTEVARNRRSSPATRPPSGRSSENSSAQLRSPLILKHDPLDDLRPYPRVRVPPDEYAKVLQANAGLAWILDDVKFFRSKCLADKAHRMERSYHVSRVDDGKCGRRKVLGPDD